jgi:hypothetical protein
MGIAGGAYHLTVSKERNLGRRMKDMREIGVGGTAIVKHCVGSKSMVHILFSPCIEIEFILQVIDAIFLFVPLHSSTPCNVWPSISRNYIIFTHRKEKKKKKSPRADP